MNSYPLRVLIVDDDIAQSQALAKLLKSKIKPAQLETFFSNTLEEGISLAKELIPCIVFLDLVFPGQDWKTTAAAIPRFNGQVVVVTMMDTLEVEMECRKHGALTVFSKAKIQGVIEIIIHVVTNIRLNSLAREGRKDGCN